MNKRLKHFKLDIIVLAFTVMCHVTLFIFERFLMIKSILNKILEIEKNNNALKLVKLPVNLS